MDSPLNPTSLHEDADHAVSPAVITFPRYLTRPIHLHLENRRTQSTYRTLSEPFSASILSPNTFYSPQGVNGQLNGVSFATTIPPPQAHLGHLPQQLLLHHDASIRVARHSGILSPIIPHLPRRVHILLSSPPARAIPHDASIATPTEHSSPRQRVLPRVAFRRVIYRRDFLSSSPVSPVHLVH